MRAASRAWLLAMCAMGGGAGCDVVFGIEEGQLRPEEAPPEPFDVTGSITADTTWTRDTIPTLRGAVGVETGATLTIEAGTTVLAGGGAVLVVGPGARLVAEGTREAPIVFTSAATSRRAGDWVGVVLCGRARINLENGVAVLPDVTPGADPSCGGSDDEDSSGALRYVRVEFASRDDPGLGALALIGVGRGTTIDHVQIHRPQDDAVYALGGTARLSHVLVVGGDDEGIDWENGWRGAMQFFAVLKDGNVEFGNGIEGENAAAPAPDPALASSPTLYNVTLVGERSGQNVASGVKLEAGTRGALHNMVATEWVDSALDVDDAETFAAAQSGALRFTHSILANVNDFTDETDFDEESWAMAPANMNRRLAVGSLGIRSVDPAAPDFSLAPGSPALTGGAAPPADGFFDPAATFVGACGEACPDFEGWTDFPLE